MEKLYKPKTSFSSISMKFILSPKYGCNTPEKHKKLVRKDKLKSIYKND